MLRFLSSTQRASALCFHLRHSHNPKGHIDVIKALVAQGGPSILDIQDADGEPAYLRCRDSQQRASSLALVALSLCMCLHAGAAITPTITLSRHAGESVFDVATKAVKKALEGMQVAGDGDDDDDDGGFLDAAHKK